VNYHRDRLMFILFSGLRHSEHFPGVFRSDLAQVYVFWNIFSLLMWTTWWHC